MIHKIIKRDRFVSICGTNVEEEQFRHADGNEMPKKCLLELYVILEALEALKEL